MNKIHPFFLLTFEENYFGQFQTEEGFINFGCRTKRNDSKNSKTLSNPF